MHLVSAIQPRLAFLPRTVVAVVLVLALLSGIVTFSSQSAGHLCAMECCSGLAPHAAGSCHMEMSSHGKVAKGPAPKPKSDKHCEVAEASTEPISGVAAGVMGMKDGAHSALDLDSVTIDASDHCKPNSHSASLNPPSRNYPSRPASISQSSFSKPCPPDCGTGVLSSGVRPANDNAARVYNARPRPPTLAGNHHYFQPTFLIASAYCKQVGPRGPPWSLA